MATQTQENVKEQSRGKQQAGIVVSSKMQKTIVVKVERTFRHPLFGKTLRRFKKFKVHDEKNDARLGDKVLICESRPYSKEKHWALVQILERSEERRLKVEEQIEQKEIEQKLREEKERHKEEKEKARAEMEKKAQEEPKDDTAADEA